MSNLTIGLTVRLNSYSHCYLFSYDLSLLRDLLFLNEKMLVFFLNYGKQQFKVFFIYVKQNNVTFISVH